jgi:hypothetical protein
MSHVIAVRLQERTLSQLDRERKRAGLSRAGAVNEALQGWIAKRQYEHAVRRDQEGYERLPVAEGEFETVLGAQPF